MDAVKSDRWSDVARWSEEVNLFPNEYGTFGHQGDVYTFVNTKLFDCKQVLFCFVTLATCSRQSVIEWPV